jgi:hypothetical protein
MGLLPKGVKQTLASLKWTIPKKIGKTKKKARKQLIPASTCSMASHRPASMIHRKLAKLVPVILFLPNSRASASSFPKGNAAKPVIRNAAIPKGIPTSVQHNSKPSSNQLRQVNKSPPKIKHKRLPTNTITHIRFEFYDYVNIDLNNNP